MRNKDMDNKVFWTSETQMFYERKCILKATGCHVIDSDNNKYLDANSGTWNVFLGHGNKEIGTCIDKQITKLDYLSNHQFFHEEGEKLASRLINLFPKDTFASVYFTSGGAEAVDTALKISKQFWYNKNEKGKHRFISLFESYHGSTIGATSVSGDPWDRVPFDTILNDSIHIYPQYCYNCRLGLDKSNCNLACIKDLEYKINFYGAENISSIIIEPVMGVGGVIIPSREYLKELVELCHKNNILVIFDEVTSGIGRCGYYFACMKFGIYPDLLLFGKAISNGSQPLAGIMISKKIYDAFCSKDSEMQFRHGFTNSGHPVACAAGNCVLDIMERDKIIEKCRKKSLLFEQKLKKLHSYPFFGEIRIIGLMIAIELINPNDQNPLVIPKLDIILRDRGILISQMTQVIGLMPSVIMTDKEFETVLNIIIDTVNEYLINNHIY